MSKFGFAYTGSKIPTQKHYFLKLVLETHHLSVCRRLLWTFHWLNMRTFRRYFLPSRKAFETLFDDNLNKTKLEKVRLSFMELFKIFNVKFMLISLFSNQIIMLCTFSFHIFHRINLENIEHHRKKLQVQRPAFIKFSIIFMTFRAIKWLISSAITNVCQHQHRFCHRSNLFIYFHFIQQGQPSIYGPI